MHMYLSDEDQTLALGARLAAACGNGQTVIFLRGDLGAGKTTLARGFLGALGYTGKVRSPTYTLMEPYQAAGRQVVHLDLYRIAHPDELEYLGLRELLNGDAIFLVEWPERGAGALPTADLTVTLSHAESGRAVAVEAATEKGVRVQTALAADG